MPTDSGLLSEIEHDLVSGRSLADVLRKCLLLGGKTRSEDLRAWVSQEFRGYEQTPTLPAHRIVPAGIFIDGVTMFSRVSGQRISVAQLPSVAQGKIGERLELRDGVGGLEALADQAHANGGYSRISLPGAAEIARLMSANSEDEITGIYWEVSETAVKSTIDQIRTSLTELVSELRARTPDDEDLPSPEAAARAVNVVLKGRDSTVNITTVAGSMSDSQIQQDTSNSSQTMGELAPGDIDAISRFLGSVERYMDSDDCDITDSEELRVDLETIKEELRRSRPRVGVLKELLKSVRSTTEGALGVAGGAGLVAAGALLPHIVR